MQLEIWSDVVCPWCYIGKRRLEAALERFPHRDRVEVVWRSFELDPQAVGSREGGYVQRLAAKYGVPDPQAQQMVDTMAATGAAEGVEMAFDRAQPGSTFDAHRVLHLAAGRGVQDAVKERLMRGYFTEGEAVADHPTLVRLAAEAGLAEDETAAVLASDRYAEQVRADEAQAAAFGISGVPFFVVDRRYGVSGAQPPEVLLEVLERAWSESQPLTVLTPGGGEACADGSCAV